MNESDYEAGKQQRSKWRVLPFLLFALASFFGAMYLSGAFFSIYLIKTGEGPWKPDGFILTATCRVVAGPVAVILFALLPKKDVSRGCSGGLSFLQCFLISIGGGFVASIVGSFIFPY